MRFQRLKLTKERKSNFLFNAVSCCYLGCFYLERRRKNIIMVEFIAFFVGYSISFHILQQFLPFGKPGGGAPLRTESGSVKASLPMDSEIRFQKRDRDQIHDVIVPVS